MCVCSQELTLGGRVNWVRVVPVRTRMYVDLPGTCIASQRNDENDENDDNDENGRMVWIEHFT